jgi:hypothetical protein
VLVGDGRADFVVASVAAPANGIFEGNGFGSPAAVRDTDPVVNGTKCLNSGYFAPFSS